MSKRTLATVPSARAAVAFLAILLFAQAPCRAEPATAGISDSGNTPAGNHRPFRVQGPSQQLEMLAGTSRTINLNKGIPKVLVNDPGTVKVTPVAADRIGVTALKPGITQINLWDSDGNVHTVDVTVRQDPSEIEARLREMFPNCTLRVRPVGIGVLISGRVDTPKTCKEIVKIAEESFPNVINKVTVVGSPTIKLHVALLELSLTKMEAEGIDRDELWGTENYELGDKCLCLVDDRDGLADTVKRLKRKEVARVLASPTLLTVGGRAANFEVGTEVPVSVGEEAVEYKFVGTQVEFIPRVLGNGKLRLDTRLDVFDENSKRDEPTGLRADATRSLGCASSPRDLTVGSCPTETVDFRPGQTLILAGQFEERVESKGRLVPLLAEMPLVGTDLARKMERVERIQTVLIVTPRWKETDVDEPESAEKFGAVAVVSDQGSVQTK